jgi:hypothetical protein
MVAIQLPADEAALTDGVRFRRIKALLLDCMIGGAVIALMMQLRLAWPPDVGGVVGRVETLLILFAPMLGCWAMMVSPIRATPGQYVNGIVLRRSRNLLEPGAASLFLWCVLLSLWMFYFVYLIGFFWALPDDSINRQYKTIYLYAWLLLPVLLGGPLLFSKFVALHRLPHDMAAGLVLVRTDGHRPLWPSRSGPADS